jgi:hypothetical protein
MCSVAHQIILKDLLACYEGDATLSCKRVFTMTLESIISAGRLICLVPSNSRMPSSNPISRIDSSARKGEPRRLCRHQLTQYLKRYDDVASRSWGLQLRETLGQWPYESVSGSTCSVWVPEPFHGNTNEISDTLQTPAQRKIHANEQGYTQIVWLMH